MPSPARCLSCGSEFDALTAPWCHCVGKDRTVVCPHCRRCFCAAPREERDAFWLNATPEMWARRRAEQQSKPVHQNPPPNELKRPAVLVVDDDRVVQKVAAAAVQRLGYGVIVASDGEQGLWLVEEYRPQLVLTDALMPRLDGRELTRRIKADYPAIRVVIMTATYTGARHKHEALKHFKPDDYILKPIAVQRLGEILQKYLG